MSHKRDKQTDPAGDAAPEAESPAAEFDAAQVDAAEEDPVVRLEGEVAVLKDQLLRALAETENIRRRSARERDDAVKFAAVPLIKDIIGVADNLRRALSSVPADAAGGNEAGGNEQLKTLLDGVEMTEKDLQSVFARHGIERIDPMGERLDPHFHEALFEVPDASVPAGTVVQVLQAGYRLRERLIRPAQVGIAKGGPSATAANPDRADQAPAGETSAGDNGGGDGNAQQDPGSRYDTSA